KKKQIQVQLAKQETQRKALLGKWERTAEYGIMILDLKEDGKGVMTIEFNSVASFIVGSGELEADIVWKVTGDNHVIFDSVEGRPEKAFHYVTVTLKRGTHRDLVVTSLEQNTFKSYDVGKENKITTWKRIKETAKPK
ncbi:MAG: hypothetical protein KDA84_04625, partial [Planctomycetaceae bacterium]|nr:hypothetical protein [Planctomycetaceae bacterium]